MYFCFLGKVCEVIWRQFAGVSKSISLPSSFTPRRTKLRATREEAINGGRKTHLHSTSEEFSSLIQARNFKVTVETEIWICLYHLPIFQLWVGVRWLDHSSLHANSFFRIGCRYAMPMLHRLWYAVSPKKSIDFLCALGHDSTFWLTKQSCMSLTMLLAKADWKKSICDAKESVPHPQLADLSSTLTCGCVQTLVSYKTYQWSHWHSPIPWGTRQFTFLFKTANIVRQKLSLELPEVAGSTMLPIIHVHM